MDVKQAAKLAKDYVSDLFADERIADVGLEEIERESNQRFWNVTVGFSRPWDQRNPTVTTLGQTKLRRSYKQLRINDETGAVHSVRDRVLRRAE